MQKRSRKKQDINELSTSIVSSATNQDDKNPAAVALGSVGSLKGGKARADKLTSEQRNGIAKKAAQTRWGKT